MSDQFENFTVISSYTVDDAISDGVLVQILPHRWEELTGGIPLVATTNVHANISVAGIMEIWNEYVHWVKNVESSLPEEERMFSTTMNERTVWVIYDGTAVTVLYPEDY